MEGDGSVVGDNDHNGIAQDRISIGTNQSHARIGWNRSDKIPRSGRAREYRNLKICWTWWLIGWGMPLRFVWCNWKISKRHEWVSLRASQLTSI